jgi:hypothetical protein
MFLTHIVALVVLVLPVAAQAQARASFKACQDRASIDSAQYPQRIDKGTTIMGVSCKQTERRVVYVYDNRLDARRSQLSKDAMKKQAVAIRAMLCTNPSLTALLKLVDMEYTFYDAENVFVGTVTNRIEDCGSN